MNPDNTKAAAKLHVRKKRIENALAFYRQIQMPRVKTETWPESFGSHVSSEDRKDAEDYLVSNVDSHEVHQSVLSDEAIQAMTVMAVADLQIQLTEVIEQIKAL